MLLMGAIANHGSILDGPPDRRLLWHNADAFKVLYYYDNNNLFELILQDEIYYFVGKAIVYLYLMVVRGLHSFLHS